RSYPGGHYDGDECDKNHQSHGCDLSSVNDGSHDYDSANVHSDSYGSKDSADKYGSKDRPWTGDRDYGQHRDRGRDNGYDAHAGVLKQIESDNNAAPGPYVKVGSAISWTYTVTNTGNVALTNIVVTDDKEGPICTI